jgi:NUMOD3 motif
MACVYALSSSSDPSNVRYIGRSKHDDPSMRLKNHIQEATRSVPKKTYIYNWIRNTLASGHTIIVVVLETGLTIENSALVEILKIKEYKDLGYSLTNMTDGGEGWMNPSAEAIEARSKKNRGSTRSEETKKRMSDAQQGRVISEEHRAKLIEARRKRTDLSRDSRGRYVKSKTS